MVGGQPLEERAALGHLALGQRRGLGLEGLHEVEGALVHGGPVLDGGAHVAEDAPDVVVEPVERVGPGLPADLEMEERLGELGRLSDPDEAALRVAGHPDLRVDDERYERATNVQRHADGVDQERHVVRHDVDHGDLGGPPSVVGGDQTWTEAAPGSRCRVIRSGRRASARGRRGRVRGGRPSGRACSSTRRGQRRAGRRRTRPTPRPARRRWQVARPARRRPACSSAPRVAPGFGANSQVALRLITGGTDTTGWSFEVAAGV